MAKSKERNKARELRKEGKSIREIARKLNVSRSSVSVWCRDIKLTLSQLRKLEKRRIKGGYKGRLKGARRQLEERLARIQRLHKEGSKLINKLSERDLLLKRITIILESLSEH